ncbi:hypothetical protein [Gracilibacillus lacisalsi]|uniref:hypothetical protein n=1 Tax=Gracilibacillus lacisalsi TaxID=393087 RepID=UPI0003739903|nr:hypothetical protein [Gracilibacillus lacisalsi]
MGLMNRVLAVGAAGAAIYGITRGVQNGTFQRLPETVNNALNNPQVQQFTKPVQNMLTNQNQNNTQPANAVQNAVQTVADEETNDAFLYEQ